MIPAVAMLRLGNLLAFAFDVGARQVVQQHVEARLKQLLPALPQMIEQRGLVLPDAVQTAIQAVLLRHREARAQQISHGALVKPLPVQTELAARRHQPAHHQQLQHLRPRHFLPPLAQTLFPKLAQPQLPPQFAPQPVVAKRPRPPQLHLLQLHLHAVQRVGRKRPVLRKQTQARRPLLGFIKHLQRLAPRRLLTVVDLAQIQNPPLHHPARTQPPTLLHAPIAVLLAVLASLVRCAETCQRASCQLRSRLKRG